MDPSTPRRTVVVVVGGMAILVVLLSGFVFKDRIREEWYLSVLTTGDEDERVRAAENLGKLGSVLAVRELLRLAGTAYVPLGEKGLGWMRTEAGDAYLKAVKAIGNAGLVEVLKGLCSVDRATTSGAWDAIEEIFYEEYEITPYMHTPYMNMVDFLGVIEGDATEPEAVREAAREARKRVQGELEKKIRETGRPYH